MNGFEFLNSSINLYTISFIGAYSTICDANISLQFGHFIDNLSAISYRLKNNRLSILPKINKRNKMYDHTVEF